MGYQEGAPLSRPASVSSLLRHVFMRLMHSDLDSLVSTGMLPVGMRYCCVWGRQVGTWLICGALAPSGTIEPPLGGSRYY